VSEETLEWQYARSDGHVIRWPVLPPPESAPPAAPADPWRVEVLTEERWRVCGPILSWRLWSNRRRSVLTKNDVERLRQRACCPVAAEGRRSYRMLVPRGKWWLRWVFSPPLGWGAPRWLKRSKAIVDVRKEGEQSFEDSLGNLVDDGVVQNATAGWEAARTRLAGIETRAGTFVQAAALTSTLILVNQGLIVGDHPVRTAPAKWVFLGAIVVASVALVISGIYGLFATMRTFDRVVPNSVARIIERSKLQREPTDRTALDLRARKRHVAAVLMAQRRTSLVGDWKLARLKRATVFFGIAIAAIALASGTFLVDATTHKGVKKAGGKPPGTASKPPKRPTFPDLASATIKPGDNGSFIYTMPAFDEAVSGVVHFVTHEPLPVPGKPDPQHVPLATKPVEARGHHRAWVRIALSPWARRALTDHGTLEVGVRLEVRGDKGLSGYDASSCITLGVTEKRTRPHC
jgi:hypothetical protein